MPRQQMSKWDRIMAARSGEAVDRVPVSLWHHWPGVDVSADTLAEGTLALQKRFDFDFVKVTPSGLCPVADWGVRVGPPYTTHGEPTILRTAVTAIEDWDRCGVLDPTVGRLAQEVGALRAISNGLGGSAPLVQTFFMPLSTAAKMCGDAVLKAHMHDHPAAIHRALRVVTESTVAYIRACCTTGKADGAFLSTKHAGAQVRTREDYLEFGLPYDLEVLERIKDVCKLTILHLHGDEVYYDLFTAFPVDFINWHDRTGKMPIAQAAALFTCGLMAGVSNTAGFIAGASPADLAAQAKDAIAQTGGRRLVVAPQCVLPLAMTEQQYDAIRQAVE